MGIQFPRKRAAALFTAAAILLLEVGASQSLLTASAASATTSYDESVRDDTGLRIGQTTVLYDNSIGMPTSEANAIAQTADGFIWIGSYSGLLRYDGSDFYRYDASYGISSVISLFVDSKDRLWVGTNDTGVCYMEDGELRFYTRDDGLTSLSIRSIDEDANGNILIATTQGMAYVDPDNEMHALESPYLDGVYINEIHADEKGRIVGETNNSDFFMIEDLAVTHFLSSSTIKEGVVNCINIDPNREGYVYLGTETSEIIHGDIRNDMKGYEVIDTPEQDHINYVGVVDNELWICADDGIAYIDKNGNYQKLQKVDVTNSVDGMMQDFEGNLWFVSSRQGVMKITSSIFTDVSRFAGLPDLVCNATYLQDGWLYIGTDTGLVLLNPKGQEKKTAIVKMLDGIRIRSIKGDTDGNVWFCTYSDYGLVCLQSDGEIVHYNTEDGLASNRVRTMIECSDGAYLVSASGGVSVLQNGRVTKNFDASTDGMTNTEILSICEDDDGKIYFGSDGDGIYVLENDKITDHIDLSNGLKSEVVMRVKKDDLHDCLWCVTSNSIAFIRDGETTSIDRFPYANNFDIQFDENGNIWVLSSNGIYVANAENVMKNGDIEYVHFDGANGLTHVTTANSRNWLTDDGNLYIAGTSGVTRVNINDVHTGSANVKLVVPFIDVDDDNVRVTGDTITIPSNCKRLTIYGYALSYALNNPRVSYQLRGFDTEATLTDQSNLNLEAATYTNLKGGTYTYHLATVNTLTGEEEETLDLTIIKQKGLLEQWWFRILIVIVAAGIVVLIVALYFRQKTAAIQEREREKQTLINEVIHAFAKTIDMKDKYTNGHSFRVARYTRMLAEKMGYDESEVDSIYNIALLHDIGKISIPDSILNKPEGLNDEEYEIMKTHAKNGYDVLKDITVAPDLAIGAGYHHERLDGKGYPFGKAGDEIPQVARIIAVADMFDAMYSTRPYRKKLELSFVIEKIQEVAGTQLDPVVVEKMVELYEEGKLKDDSIA